MEQTNGPDKQLQAVVELQFKHWQVLEATDIVQKIKTYVDGRAQAPIPDNSWPIVLGSEANDVKHLMIALREPANESLISFRARYFTVGMMLGGLILPSQHLGITDEEIFLIDDLFTESVHLRDTTAPGYSLESGLIR